MRGARIAPFLLAATAFAAALLLEGKVREARPRFQTGVTEEADVLPPSFQLLSTLLGSFRTLLVDFLWVRAEALQEEGRYFAAAGLARWITALQSRVEGGWSFQAWNLGVNVPAVLPPEERWPYVRSAVDLLWKDGLKANPGSLGLRYEICWLWQYKIAGEIDPAAPIYRQKVEELVGQILGPKPYDVAAFARADGLLDLLRAEEAVAALVEALGQEGISNVEEEWPRLWADPGLLPADRRDAFQELVREEPILRAFDQALRARAWGRTFGIHMAQVSRAVDRYGEIEIGSPEGFVILWASEGLSKLEPGAVRLDGLALWRMRFRALRSLFRAGGMHLAAAIDRDFREIIDLVEADPVHRDQKESLAADRRNFLAEAVPILYLNGWRRTAQRLFGELRGIDSAIDRELSCEDFAFRAVLSELEVGKAARSELLALLRGLVRQSFWAWSSGEGEGALEYLAFARDLHRAASASFGIEAFPRFERLLEDARAEEQRRLGRPSLGRDAQARAREG